MSYANRGMAFEKLVDMANTQYKNKKIAHVDKVPTSWNVIRKGPNIVSAFPKKKSGVDYVGVVNGVAICFDAKSTKSKTSFPLANIEQHQMDFMESFELNGGRAFILLEYATLHQIFVIPYKKLSEFWEVAKNGGRKSIPLSVMAQFPMVKSQNGIVLDYLSCL